MWKKIFIGNKNVEKRHFFPTYKALRGNHQNQKLLKQFRTSDVAQQYPKELWPPLPILGMIPVDTLEWGKAGGCRRKGVASIFDPKLGQKNQAESYTLTRATPRHILEAYAHTCAYKSQASNTFNQQAYTLKSCNHIIHSTSRYAQLSFLYFGFIIFIHKGKCHVSESLDITQRPIYAEAWPAWEYGQRWWIKLR